jgi:AAA+ ATPase superfamily predicted ATPase
MNFINREQELAFLNSLVRREQPSAAQMVLLYGRRRVGKTVLARHWADSTGVPATYWAAEPESAALQRRKLYARLLDVPMAQAPVFESWSDIWTGIVRTIRTERHILILDEVPYAAESDPAFLSAIQHAWDQEIKNSRSFLLLSGSHVHTMETLLAHGSPLFGRFTGQCHLQPLEFRTLREFVPNWTVEERIAAFAIVGGVPGYLERLDPDLSLVDNIRDVVLAPGGLFIAEPELILYDEVREPRVYRAILDSIGGGAHSLDEIANTALIGKAHLSAYLARLQELGLVERRLPATVHPSKQRSSRTGRYHLTDPFLRFYFRFIAPQRDELGYHPDRVLSAIKERLRGFVGATGFEDLCRQWVLRASRTRQLPFEVQRVGSHWGRGVQIDVVGVNWQERKVIVGECKWGTDAVSQQIARDLIEVKAPKLLQALPEQGRGWRVHYALFSRAGFTPGARSLARQHRATLVDLERLDRDISKA